jgi:type IV pilus assembly protein PilA
MTKLKKTFKNAKGFTLIELMIVIAIMGILAAIAYPTIVENLGSGKATAAMDQVRAIRTAATKYAPVNGDMTDVSIQELVDNGLLPEDWADGSSVNPWAGDVSVSVDSSDVTRFAVSTDNIPEDTDGANMVRTMEDEAASNTTPSYSGGSFSITFAIN